MARKLTTPRIGPRMLAALAVIAAHPGCTKQYVSVRVGPHGSNNFGWRTVQRTIAAGLVDAELTSRGYMLYLTEAGRLALSGTECEDCDRPATGHCLTCYLPACSRHATVSTAGTYRHPGC